MLSAGETASGLERWQREIEAEVDELEQRASAVVDAVRTPASEPRPLRALCDDGAGLTALGWPCGMPCIPLCGRCLAACACAMAAAPRRAALATNARPRGLAPLL